MDDHTLTPPFWVVSDTHWFHRNIVKYCDRPDNHDRIMVERWNSVVGEHDTVLHLGDLFMWPNKYDHFADKIAPRLNGGRKYIILGNHDDPKLDYKGIGFVPVDPFRIQYKGHWVEFSHYPSDGMMPGYLRVHGHIHNTRSLERRRCANVSVEVIDYTPRQVTDVIEEALERDAANT